MESKSVLVAAFFSILIFLASSFAFFYWQTITMASIHGTPRELQTNNNGTTQLVSTAGENHTLIVIASPYAKEFDLPKDSWPNGILVDSEDTVWTVGSKSNSLISLSSSDDIRSYPLPTRNNTEPLLTWTMVADDKDHAILLAGSAQNPILRFDERTETFQSMNPPSAPPIQMKMDGRGNIWYALQSGSVGVLEPTGQENGAYYNLTRQVDVGNDSFPSGVFMQGHDLWITKSLAGKLAVFNVTYGHDGKRIENITKIADYPQNGSTLFTPTDIIVSNDSAWITEHDTSVLTNFDIKTQQVTRYPTSLHPIQITTLPYWLARAPDGRGIWFNEHRGNRIGFFDLANHTMTEYEVPTRNPQMGYIANVLTLAADPTDPDRAWFTELTENKIGYVDKSVSMPFDIRASYKQVVVEKSKTVVISIAVVRNPGIKLFNNSLSFNVSSSVIVSGILPGAKVDFSPNPLDLQQVNGTQTIKMHLRDEEIPRGQYVLGISATDGAVVRTVYVELIAK